MSTKRKHIQEVNLILERRYLIEQTSAVTPSNTTVVQPPQNTNTPTTGETTTTTTTSKIKMDKSTLKSMSKCSNTGIPSGVVSATTYDNHIIYTKNNGLFCKDEIVED